MDYIVSAHGGRYAQPKHEIWLPEGFTVNYFVDDGEALYNNDAWPIYNHLLAGDTKSVQGKIVESVTEGQKTYNYSCWNYPELNNNSGIFKVGACSTKSPIIDLSPYTGDDPLTLAQLIDKLPEPGVIYWVACQGVS